MTKTGKTKTKITKEIIKQVQELAESGFNNIMISKALNIAPQTLSTNKELKECLQRGKMILSQKVTASILETLEDTPSNQQMLAKRLCLFLPTIAIAKPKSAKDALENLAVVTKLFADGEINESQLRTIEAVSNSYVKGYDTIDIEERVKKLEEAANGK